MFKIKYTIYRGGLERVAVTSEKYENAARAFYAAMGRAYKWRDQKGRAGVLRPIQVMGSFSPSDIARSMVSAWGGWGDCYALNAEIVNA